MKIDRFWTTQIFIFVTLFALLIGSYLLSSPPAAVTYVDKAAEVTTRTATCTKKGAEPSPEAINDSLSSHDSARQTSCLEFLRAESTAGDKGAELWLGRAYHNGWGVDKDLAQAATHYGKAATATDSAISGSARQWQLELEQEQQKASR